MVKNTRDPRNHPKVKEAFGLMERGRMDRREFIRVAALLGVSAGAAYAMAGVPKPAFAAENTPFVADDPNAKAGGILRVGMQVQKMEDPATYSWVEMSNQSRHTLEYLTMTGIDNITRPMLAESWEANDDLTVWTFKLREGVMWHNGDELVADHIVWNVQRWLDPTLGSSNVGLSTFASMRRDSGKKDENGKAIMEAIDGAVEAVDKYTVRFNLAKPVLSVPEDCYNYPTAILHPSFKAPLSDNMIGTGPFALSELRVGERCILKRVTKTSDGKDFKYWGGKVYLDEIHYYNFDEDAQLTAVASGDVDAIYEFGIEQVEFARALPNTQIISAQTAQTLVLRMRVDTPPFDDIRVRKAIQMAADREAITKLVYPEGGVAAEDHHVAQLHPEYFPLPKQVRDVEGAKKLLKEAGKENLEVTIDVGNTDGPWHQTACEALRDQLKDAGIRLNINVMPASKYWEIWDKTLFGATAWTHRPLGTMVLSLGYRSGVPWNETQFSDPEFDKALDEAESTLDVEERRKKMETVQKILQDAAVMVQPLWRPVYTLTSNKVHGYPAHPTQYHQFNKVWLG